MTAYYNEIDPFVAQWLRNLIQADLIAPGYVDERDIRDIKPYELEPYTQCHFFAGIGGWSYALRLAGVSDHVPLWTGSCPCQPFSAAGKQRGTADERHLWPFWQYLIQQCRPPVIFGEQVAQAIGHGWLDLVFSDLEAEGYACGAAVLPACSVGAPHIRQRLWFVAKSDSAEREAWQLQSVGNGARSERATQPSLPDKLANGFGTGLEVEREQPAWDQRAPFERGGATGELDYAASARGCGGQPFRTGRSSKLGGPSANSNPWRNLEWLSCTDGKARPTQPSLFPLAHGISARVGKLRAAGNAIVPQLAAEFIKASLDFPNSSC